jgi:uncharacterized protein (DUF58 family)
MLSAELIRKIKRIHIKSRRMVDTAFAGSYRSVFRGSGIEFEEVREYAVGDDVKSIDWNVSARMGRPYVKLYREERELVIMLLLDMSASGRFGAAGRAKRDVFLETAAVLAVNAIRNNDTVGAILFTSGVEKFIPPKKSGGHAWRVIREMVAFQPALSGTDLAAACDFLAKAARKKTVCFIISDFLTDGYHLALKRAAGRHDIIAVNVVDPGDFVLPEAGIVAAKDLETGRPALFDCADPKVRRAYERRRRQQYVETNAGLKSAGADVLELRPGDSPADGLAAFFRQRERRRSW